MSPAQPLLGGRRFDVAVVGAGPAGAHCARRLAAGGLDVALVDRVAPPRYKTCGGGLVWRARRELGLEAKVPSEGQFGVVELRLFEPSVAAFRVARPEPLITMTMRSALDSDLVDRARRAGAELFAPAAVEHLHASPEEVALATGAGKLVARFVVAADGAGSRVASLAGWPHQPQAVPALESELVVRASVLERFAGVPRFDFGPVPAGYAWVFPKRHHLSVGCLTLDRRGRGLRRYLDLYLETLGLAGAIEERRDHGFVIPIRPRARHLARERILLVGDAAGLADPVTCEGIYHAALSGRLAAEAIVAHPHDAPAAVRAYQRALHRKVLAELRWARRLAALLYGAPRLRRAVFRYAGQPLVEAMGRVYAGETGYRRLFTRPSAYLRLLRRLVAPPARRAELSEQ